MIGEITMTTVPPIVEYLCPACGNPYLGRSIASYTVLRSIKYTDGFVARNIPYELWLSRCPKCRQFFAKKHLFKFPMTHKVAQYVRYDRYCKDALDFLDQFEDTDKLPRRKDNDRENQELYGNYEYSLRNGESAVEFLEQAIEQGLYFPVNVRENEKEEANIMLHRTLWWIYNLHIDEISDEKYVALCNKLIEMLIGTKIFIHEKELMLAELYRNIGNFEESLKYLETVIVNQDTQAHVDCIREQIKLGNRKTAIVEKHGF